MALFPLTISVRPRNPIVQGIIATLNNSKNPALSPGSVYFSCLPLPADQNLVYKLVYIKYPAQGEALHPKEQAHLPITIQN
jgi:hypothetical protein